jgi:small subunit ribosomal protein S23
MIMRQRGMLIGSCVQFTLSLHRYHDVPLTQAYTIATKEFVKLRGAHELATQAAQAEARAHGAIFTSDPWVHTNHNHN